MHAHENTCIHMHAYFHFGLWALALIEQSLQPLAYLFASILTWLRMVVGAGGDSFAAATVTGASDGTSAGALAGVATSVATPAGAETAGGTNAEEGTGLVGKEMSRGKALGDLGSVTACEAATAAAGPPPATTAASSAICPFWCPEAAAGDVDACACREGRCGDWEFDWGECDGRVAPSDVCALTRLGGAE